MTRRMSQISTQQESVDEITTAFVKTYHYELCYENIERSLNKFFLIETILSYSHHSE